MHREALRADWLVSPGRRPRQAPPTLAKLTGRLPRLGCDPQTILRWPVLGQEIPLTGIAHNCGTVRFGIDPSDPRPTSTAKAHDVDNLDVIDTNAFAYSSAVNPSLTPSANALRVGDHFCSAGSTCHLPPAARPQARARHDLGRARTGRDLAHGLIPRRSRSPIGRSVIGSWVLPRPDNRPMETPISHLETGGWE